MKKVIIFILSMVMLLSTTEVSAMEFDETANFTQATLLMEAETGQVLKEENGYEKLPIGTLNKVMTTLLVAESIERKELSAETLVTTSEHANSMQQAQIWLLVGEQMSVADLLKGVIIGNANDACVALAEAVAGSEEEFTGLMNERAKELGMNNTLFLDCTGLNEEGQYSTANDVALMGREIVKYRWLYEYMTTWLDYVRDGKTELVNENTLVRDCPSLTGIKAGHSAVSGNNVLASAERDGVTYISVVLGCKDKKKRFSIARNLLNAGFEQFKVINPSFSREFMKPVNVKGGTLTAVEVDAQKLKSLAVPVSSEEITNAIVLPKYIKAPVKKGQPVGIVGFYCGDELIYETELVAVNDIEKMTVSKAFSKLFTSLFR